MSDERQPEGEATLRVVAMPSDVNINGDIFGGWVLSQMDIASGIVAAQRAKGRVTTVAVDAMKFIRPVQVGNILCVWGLGGTGWAQLHGDQNRGLGSAASAGHFGEGDRGSVDLCGHR